LLNISCQCLFQQIDYFKRFLSKKSLKTLKKGINKLHMIRSFIYQTYNSCKLDKKNQSILKDTLKLRKVDSIVA